MPKIFPAFSITKSTQVVHIIRRYMHATVFVYYSISLQFMCEVCSFSSTSFAFKTGTDVLCDFLDLTTNFHLLSNIQMCCCDDDYYDDLMDLVFFFSRFRLFFKTFWVICSKDGKNWNKFKLVTHTNLLSWNWNYLFFLK